MLEASVTPEEIAAHITHADALASASILSSFKPVWSHTFHAPIEEGMQHAEEPDVEVFLHSQMLNSPQDLLDDPSNFTLGPIDFPAPTVETTDEGLTGIRRGDPLRVFYLSIDPNGYGGNYKTTFIVDGKTLTFSSRDKTRGTTIEQGVILPSGRRKKVEDIDLALYVSEDVLRRGGLQITQEYTS